MGNIVVTGGSSGVGAALVRRLVQAGHQVFNLDVTEPAAPLAGQRFVRCDLGDASAIATAAAALPASLQGLANVAGMARATDPVRVVAVNFLGLREITRTLTPRLAAGSGIVNVSSIAGRDWRARLDRITPLLDTASMADGLAWCRAQTESFARDPYSFSKRCVTAFSLREAREHVHRSTRILCVSPGGIDTPLSPQFEALMGSEQTAWSRSQVGRPAVPDEIAQVIEMLLCQPCGWLNGVDIPVDRGYCAGLESGWIDFSQSPVMQALRERKRPA
ncbi:MAG: SDR family oxidoreductase [Betaproteobacteria bacterium]|nr:SDR family oxidoreductase [Betaproteobacteria bacterium]